MSNSGIADSVLVARARAGDDRHAYAELVRRHQGWVRSLLRRLCKEDHALADDLSQETFVQAWRKLASFRADAAFGTWLYRIAYNIFLMHVRGRRETLSLDELQPEPAAEAQTSPSPEAGAVIRGDVRRALARLSEPERAAIVQCYYLDRSHEEAAYAMGCPVGTVKSHIFRARQKLRETLADWAPAGAP
ncbi:MAG: sigma-70 family RNA polymerase sigma factor [Gammaproteobacteria bacterium]|nr:sigma-70 family RNA polymerase sigma factor [Gammaproteobacteria bacterium]